MAFLRNIWNYPRKSESPHTKEIGISRSPLPPTNTDTTQLKLAMDRDFESTELQTSFELNLKVEKLTKENEKLKEDKKKLLDMLIKTERLYQLRIKDLELKIDELESSLQKQSVLPSNQSQQEEKYDLNELNEMNEKLMKENIDLKNELQRKDRLREINLENEYIVTINNYLQNHQGMFYTLRLHESRKSEHFFINTDKIKLEDVIIPKVIFRNNEMEIETRKLTIDEIEELNTKRKIIIYNDGSRLTSLSAYDVVIKIETEKDRSMNKNIKIDRSVKQNAKKTSNKKEKEQPKETTKKVNEKKQEIKQEQEIKKEEAKEEEAKEIYEEKEVYISIKDAYYGIENYPIQFFNKNYNINIRPSITNGETQSFKVGKNEKGQEMITRVTFKYDTNNFVNYWREGNNLMGYFEYSKAYENQITKLKFFDFELDVEITLKDTTLQIENIGFVGEDGTRGNYIFTIKLI